jgi:hypothetical protein
VNDANTAFLGTNIPGKPKAPLNYAGGLPLYMKTIDDALQNNFDGFAVS